MPKPARMTVLLVGSQRVGDSQTRRKGLAVIVRRAHVLKERDMERLEREQGGIIQLGSVRKR